MRSRHLVISIFGVLTSLTAVAQSGTQQDTSINGATIEIIQSYKPEVQRAPRPELTPHLPPIDTTTPKQQYDVPAQTLYYSYNSLPLRPLALEVNKEPEPFGNYIKLGGGNLSTLFLDAGVSTLKGDDYVTNIHIKHLSQSGSISDQKVAHTGVDADGKLYKKGKVFGASLGIHNNRYHYYGYDHSVYTYTLDNVRQSFNDISLALDMQDELSEGKKVKYHPVIKANYFADRANTAQSNASETTFNILIPVEYTLDEHTQLYLNANAILTSFAGNIAVQKNNIFSVAPGIRFSRNIFNGHASVAPTSGNGTLYILPDIGVSFLLPETQFMFNLGWQAKLNQNTYKQLATWNPYTVNTFTVQQTRTNEVFAGIKSNLGEHISFSGRVSWWSYDNLPVYINDTAGDKKQFEVLYDTKVNAIGLQASIRYHVAETFAIGFSGQWLNFYNKTFEHVWHRPGVKFTGDISAKPIDKLTINAYISFIDELYALDNNDRSFKLNSILDIGAGAEYEVIERLNVFIQANNLLNNSYQRWYGYDAFGMNIFGGIRFKF